MLPPPASVAPARFSATGWTAVVLAGGASRRWGGRDKTAFPLAGKPLLAHAVDAVLPGATAVAVVAPSDHPARAVIETAARDVAVTLAWTREDPPGGGPLAGLAAGLAALEPLRGNGPGEAPVVVLAGDLPFARTAVPRLLRALDAAPHADAVVGIDADGHRQPLLAVYRAAALRRHLPAADLTGRPVRDLLAALHVAELPVSDTESLDLDTPAEAAAAAAWFPA